MPGHDLLFFLVSRRNCKGNPHCLTGMGEREWMGDIADDSWHDVEDPNTERRKDVSTQQ